MHRPLLITMLLMSACSTTNFRGEPISIDIARESAEKILKLPRDLNSNFAPPGARIATQEIIYGPEEQPINYEFALEANGEDSGSIFIDPTTGRYSGGIPYIGQSKYERNYSITHTLRTYYNEKLRPIFEDNRLEVDIKRMHSVNMGVGWEIKFKDLKPPYPSILEKCPLHSGDWFVFRSDNTEPFCE